MRPKVTKTFPGINLTDRFPQFFSTISKARSRKRPNRSGEVGAGPHCTVLAMITSQGFGLIAELIAAAMLTAALAGFAVRRSQPWLVGVAIASIILVVAVTIVINSST